MRNSARALVGAALALLGCSGAESVGVSGSTGTEVTGGGGRSGSGGSGGEPGTGAAGGGGSGGGGAGCPVASSSDALVAPTAFGNVRGQMDQGTLSFRGVPYAAPPVDALRFRAPEPPACWAGVRDATDYGNACVQDLPTGSAFGDEDCLYLNVWTPAKSGKRPVLFFVHGGAYLFGSGSQDLLIEGTGNLYRGSTLASEHDVVVVTINHRLGELGFLAHPSLAGEDAHGSSGNYGNMDQLAALRWVKDNIAAFGGDPDDVMLFGESAGGLSTCLLLSSPLSKGLFSSALMESGGCTVASREARFTQGASIVDAVGCTDAADVPACLRSKSPDDFRVPPPTGINMFLADGDINSAWDMPSGPNIDGYVFEEQPLEALKNGHHAKVPLVVGSNATEFGLFFPPGVINTCADYWAAMYGIFGDGGDDVIAEYSCFDYTLPHDAAVAVGTDFMFTCPARRVLRAAKQGGTPVAYRYFDPHTYTDSPLTLLGSFHASELPYVFRTFDVMGYDPTSGDTALSKAIGGYWTRFSRTGDPNGNGAVAWPAWEAASDTALVLDDAESTQSGIHSAHCDFWDDMAGQ